MKTNWWAGWLGLEVSNDQYGEFYSVPIKRYADSLEDEDGHGDEYFEMEYATSRRLNAAYEACGGIDTALLEEGIISEMVDAIEELLYEDRQYGRKLLQDILARIKSENHDG